MLLILFWYEKKFRLDAKFIVVWRQCYYLLKIGNVREMKKEKIR